VANASELQYCASPGSRARLACGPHPMDGLALGQRVREMPSRAAPGGFSVTGCCSEAYPVRQPGAPSARDSSTRVRHGRPWRIVPRRSRIALFADAHSGIRGTVGVAARGAWVCNSAIHHPPFAAAHFTRESPFGPHPQE
jgi:hypothetical protein